MKSTQFPQPTNLALVLVCLLMLSTATVAADDPDQHNHPPIQQDKKVWVVETEDGTRPIEDLTAYCLDCHGDLESASTQKGPTPESKVHSHPVDQPYPENGTELVPLEELDKRLLLVDGKMTCITCHAPESPDRHLVIPDAFGKLCISCHKK